MSPEIKAELQIPDLWYDFYARLLPGTAFSVALRFFVLQDRTVPDFGEMLILAASGFFCALLTQPFSSRAAGWIERGVERIKGKDRYFVRTIQRGLGTDSRRAMILSKMHGEVTFFVQLATLSAIFKIIERSLSASSFRLGWYALALVGFSIAAAFDVAARRLQRAIDEDAIMSGNPVSWPREDEKMAKQAPGIQQPASTPAPTPTRPPSEAHANPAS